MKDTEKKPKRLHSDIVRDSINTFGTNVIGSLLSIISAFLCWVCWTRRSRGNIIRYSWSATGCLRCLDLASMPR